MTAINDHQFLVIERNGATPFKKIFIADIAGVANGGFVKKAELVDLMNISDRRTLLVIDDNNYPGTGGRNANSDHTEFLKIRLDAPLAVKARDRVHEDDDKNERDAE